MVLSRYVVMNPVRAGIVERPEDWLWSSFRATAGLEPAPPFVSTSATLHLFGEGPEPVLQARFASAVATQHDDHASLDRIRSNERILGSSAFKNRVGAA